MLSLRSRCTSCWCQMGFHSMTTEGVFARGAVITSSKQLSVPPADLFQFILTISERVARATAREFLTYLFMHYVQTLWCFTYPVKARVNLPLFSVDDAFLFCDVRIKWQNSRLKVIEMISGSKVFMWIGKPEFWTDYIERILYHFSVYFPFPLLWIIPQHFFCIIGYLSGQRDVL